MRVKDIVVKVKNENLRSNYYAGLENVTGWSGIANYKHIENDDDYPDTFQYVVKNTICFSKLRPYLAKGFIAERNIIASTEFFNFKVKNTVNIKFFLYYILNKSFIEKINNSVYGIGMPRLNWNLFSNFEVIDFCSLPKQNKIVDFLDTACSKIDNEVYLLEKKSILLDEYKNALIYETVTKGLDKNALMKDSGIEWIGEVPNHWKVKRVCDSFNGLKKITQPGRTDVLSLTLNGVIEKDIENLKGLNPESYDTYQIFKKDNLVFKLIDLENYKTSRVGRVFKDGIMSSAYIRLEGKKNTNIEYNYYQFFDLYNRGIFNSIGSNGVRSTLNRSDLLKISLVVPPQKEQIEISKFLDTEIYKITKQIELINKKVELLKEYKQSLIYEAVTGQLEIE